MIWNGLKMIADIVECKPENLKLEMEVEIIFDNVSTEYTLPRFRPRSKETQKS
jgi:hypothetical protein